jgi:hypothetical protein
MQEYITPLPGRPGPNIVQREDYKMHIVKRQYAPDHWEILIERWIPETGWTRTQILCDSEELNKIQRVLATD